MQAMPATMKRTLVLTHLRVDNDSNQRKTKLCAKVWGLMGDANNGALFSRRLALLEGMMAVNLILIDEDM